MEFIAYYIAYLLYATLNFLFLLAGLKIMSMLFGLEWDLKLWHAGWFTIIGMLTYVIELIVGDISMLASFGILMAWAFIGAFLEPESQK